MFLHYLSLKIVRFKRLLKLLSNILILQWENIFTKNIKYDLIILDDIFPHLLSSFRVAEYNRYLEVFPNSIAYTDGQAFPLIGETRKIREVIDEYEKVYPQFSSRTFKFHPLRKLRGQLVYTVFLNNAFKFIDIIERNHVPFIFTLYPGGGFEIDRETSNSKLARVCSSPNLKRIITTQKIIYDYLIDKKFCLPEKVEFIYGVVLPSTQLNKEIASKKYYQKDKESFDICFVANKYMAKGIDKGYDLFISVAKLICELYKDIFFHVVGQFNESDIDVSKIKHRIKFYGTLSTDSLNRFYSGMDIILSPNVPFVLTPGGFDGFPTGCCVEAALSGVAVFCTDVLKQNIKLKDREEIVIISRNIGEIYQVITEYYCDHQSLQELAKAGQEAFKRIFDIDTQMEQRLKLLSQAYEISTNKNL